MGKGATGCFVYKKTGCDPGRQPVFTEREAPHWKISGAPSAQALFFRGGPAFHQFVVVNGFTLRFLVGQFRLGSAGLVQPVGGILRLVELRSAFALDAGLLQDAP